MNKTVKELKTNGYDVKVHHYRFLNNEKLRNLIIKNYMFNIQSMDLIEKQMVVRL